VVDSHVHVFSPEVCGDREGFCARDPWFGALYANPKARLIEIEDLAEAMEVAGVDHAILCGFPWADPGLCRDHNACLRDAVQRFPGRLSWLGVVVPGDNSAIEMAGDCFANGARGLGELNADAQGFDWRETDRLRDLVELCIGADRPILMHTSEPVGHDYPGKGTATPEKLIPFLTAFDRARVVAAHWGGGLPFHELMPEIEAVTRNVVYDCAASTYLYRPDIFRTVLDLVGRERVLFGSDYPVLKIDRFLDRVRRIDWKDADEMRAVLGGNACRVFGIDETSSR
jgi:predicted TIM-barrel fold metal-dependent hydrolase